MYRGASKYGEKIMGDIIEQRGIFWELGCRNNWRIA